MLFRKLKLDWKYGISELLIVVVGVLIALAAEGWLQEVSLRQDERAAMGRLASDMQFDIDDITGNLGRTHRGAEAAVWLMERRNGPWPSPDSLSGMLADFTACSILNTNTSEYTTLRASGQLTNLRDPVFRQRLVNHYESYPYLSDLHDEDCRVMEEGIAAIESFVQIGLDPTGDTQPPTVTGQVRDILQNATFQRTVGWVANLRLSNLAPMGEAFIDELEVLRAQAIESAGN